MHRIGMGWTTHPNKNLEFCLDYNLLFTDQNTYGGQPGYSESGCFRGQLASALLRYKFTEFLSGHAIAEFFFPGDYYDDSRNDTAMMLRYELMFHW
jgi:hypothetical protein